MFDDLASHQLITGTIGRDKQKSDVSRHGCILEELACRPVEFRHGNLLIPSWAANRLQLLPNESQHPGSATVLNTQSVGKSDRRLVEPMLKVDRVFHPGRVQTVRTLGSEVAKLRAVPHTAVRSILRERMRTDGGQICTAHGSRD